MQAHALFCVLALSLFIACSNAPSGKPVTHVTINGQEWIINGEAVLAGTPAAGLLMNVRMVNSVFEDASASTSEKLPTDFSPAGNTDTFIARMPDYYAHGVRAFTISLQGGAPGYEGAVNTAFQPDGTLRKQYLDRVERVIRAADKLGAVIILSCFYQRQHSHSFALEGKTAIMNAVENVGRWIEDRGFTNVIVEISNEFAHGGFSKWKDGEWIRTVEAQVALIKHLKRITPGLLVSTSGMGDGRIAAPIAEVADYIILHFNRTPLTVIGERIEEARRFGKPVICNEDDKLGLAGAEAARLSVRSGAGWGFMHLHKNQSVPFEYDGPADDTAVYYTLARIATPGGSVDEVPHAYLSLLMVSPVDGDVFPAGSAVNLSASVTGIANPKGAAVLFFSGDKLIGEAGFPWKVTWENPSPGKYDVIAVLKNADDVELARSGAVDFEVAAKSAEP